MTDITTLDFDLLTETSWEVCNKVGGIYTVLSTKAKTLQKYYKDKVIFIGPDVWTDEHPSPDFVESKTVLKKWREQLMLSQGVTVRVGRWDIPGKPIAILVGFQGMYASNNALFGRMWELYGVDSLHAYGDYGEAAAFSHAAALVIEDLARFHGINSGKRMIAHFDEWTTGMGLLYIKDVLPEMATIFTTHATCIGRSICGNGKPLYDNLTAYNGDQMARELNMEAKHSLEKAAATQADCFTTVSDVTARECEQLLGRKPDVVTPNGFEANFVPAKSKQAEAREKARECMLRVADILTGNKYPDNSFIIITSGRCEYRNKGLDLFLDSIAKLGDLDPARKILAFVMVPAWVKCPRQDLSNSLRLNTPWHHNNPVITHELNNPWEDAVLNRIHSIGFTNDKDSRVSVIYVPCYLNGADGIFDMTYYQLLPGADATVFASYYEPWGYTPLESVAFGVPTITTSLSGFGQWVLSTSENSFQAAGVKVEQRGDYDYDRVKDAIAIDLKQLIGATPKQMREICEAARLTAHRASWEFFIEFYNKAFAIALSNEQARFQI
ncbi:MAG: glycogen/starch synthase [Bacteroidales bacterium]|nr:glycogen/starch synthase [Bacteroidales bacterium]